MKYESKCGTNLSAAAIVLASAGLLALFVGGSSGGGTEELSVDDDIKQDSVRQHSMMLLPDGDATSLHITTTTTTTMTTTATAKKGKQRNSQGDIMQSEEMTDPKKLTIASCVARVRAQYTVAGLRHGSRACGLTRPNHLDARGGGILLQDDGGSSRGIIYKRHEKGTHGNKPARPSCTSGMRAGGGVRTSSFPSALFLPLYSFSLPDAERPLVELLNGGPLPLKHGIGPTVTRLVQLFFFLFRNRFFLSSLSPSPPAPLLHHH